MTKASTLINQKTSVINPIRSMTFTYVIALSVIAVLSILIHFLLDKIIKEQSDTAAIVNISGQQRMLSQRVSLLTIEYLSSGRDEFKQEALNSLNDMKENHAFLLKDYFNALKNNQASPLSKSLHQLYFSFPHRIDKKLKIFDALILDSLTNKKPNVIEEPENFVKFSEDLVRNSLLSSLNTVVVQYELENRYKVSELRQAERLVLFVILVALLLEGMLIFRPMVNKITLFSRRLQQSQVLFEQAEIVGKTGHYTWDIKADKMIYCSKQMAKIFGITTNEALSHFTSTDAAIDLVHPEDKVFYEKTIYNFNISNKEFDIEYRIITPLGHVRHLHVCTKLPDNSVSTRPYSFGTIQDVTERKQAQQKLEHLAHYDLLTNLPNRVLLSDRLNQAMEQCERLNQSLAVAFLDLDGFKIINDTHGHTVGDELLFALSKGMNKALRKGDTLARFGGDEFIAIMVDLENIDDCKPILDRLLKAASAPVNSSGVLMQVSASIGVTIYPHDGVEADQLARHADQAMYIAKQAGKNRYHFFDTAQDYAIQSQRKEINDILSALSNNEFELYYQPKVNMRTGEVIGMEALIRWHHPVKGFLLPNSFLPVIEGHLVSVTLGEWVINSALVQINQWQRKGIILPVSVNISANQLQQDNFSNRLAELLAAHPDVKPHDLELEILETSELSDINQVIDTMNSCHELGVRFALDDFGTGYSSLTHLRRLPVNLIKIDQSFIRDMLEDADDSAIVEGVVNLAKTFQQEVIAEGVETIAHGEALLKLDCHLAQGYCIARPMPASDVPDWLPNWKENDFWQL